MLFTTLLGINRFEKFVGHIRKGDIRLPGKGDSNSHGARPVYISISMIQWIRTSRLSTRNSLCWVPREVVLDRVEARGGKHP